MDDEEIIEAEPIEEAAGSSLIVDDGCDWTAWLVWNMNSRRRLSEHVFALPPARPQVVPLSAKHKRKPRRRKIRALKELLP
ncbi:TPA: hypothetical protein QCH65_000466 [Enterobacter roggenkampii]|nr:hypothetical protein [Enterobacter roggenkampii]